jgi:heterotetrameric sarcosine oxidase alpha subunit
MTARRLAVGGRIERSASLRITFDGHSLVAHPGDTLASALLANDEFVVARSFKYHRPRGIYTAGVEEPNALVHLRSGARTEPNTRATVVEVFDGLTATSQNAWPSVRFDVGAINQLFAKFLSAGFYYKTFIGPFAGTKFWMLCEKFIRRAAGMGRATPLHDPDSYEKVNIFCDVLVVGAGPAGLSAALAAGRAGARVVLVEQDFALGGSILAEPAAGPFDAWRRSVEAELRGLANVQILGRTTAFGAYDEDVYGLIERVWDHVSAPPLGQPRQRYWLVRTRQAVLATGSIERPLVFEGNDRPGVMLAQAARTYVNRFAVSPGEKVVVATNNDGAYAAAVDLAESGSAVTVVDMRNTIDDAIRSSVEAVGGQVITGHGVLAALGRKRVSGAVVVPLDSNGRASAGPKLELPCDLIAVSGGWTPVIHLWSHRHRKASYSEEKSCFIPASIGVASMRCAGAMIGESQFHLAVEQGFSFGAAAAADAGAVGLAGEAPATEGLSGFDWAKDYTPVHFVINRDDGVAGKAFVDLQHDVALTDIDLAFREGFVSVEHLKRYTTTGMANDQGKLSNINALSRIASLQAIAVPQAGTTTFRPPYTPVAVGAIVGHEHGQHFRPIRISPMHRWHQSAGAVMIDAGAWKRPWYYPKPGENLRDAYIRESMAVRQGVGMVDVSTLGKIAVQGPDSAEFLNRIYVNKWKALKIGRVRYGVMLRDDGIVMDDGTTARLGEHDYFMTTSTANAARILANMEFLLQTAWTDLRVHVTTVTDQWAAIALAGPRSRDLLRSVFRGADLSSKELPAAAVGYGEIADAKVRIHRVSYSGELAYEIFVPSGYGLRVWEALAEAGKSFGLVTYGTEAMGALRIEKGHVAGAELDGRTTLRDIGLEGLAAADKPFVGSVLRKRPVLDDRERPSLIGLEAQGNSSIPAGSLLFSPNMPARGNGEGWVSSATWAPALSREIALGFLKNGDARVGELVRVVDFVGGVNLTAKVVLPKFYDPEGSRQNA